MCPTTIGRIHTRVAIIAFLPALLGVALSLLTQNASWIALIGIYLLLGVALDSLVYSWAIRYQPPWMTFVLALVELGILYVIATQVDLDLSAVEAIGFYWVAWLLAIWTKIALLPLVSLTYLESAGEFRRIEWSIPPSMQPVPVFSSVPERDRGGPIERAEGEAEEESKGGGRR
jgi:hypothetical protein